MAIQVQALKRTFSFNDVPLNDPGLDFTVDEVKEVYSAQYPDLITALTEGPELKDDVAHYRFVRNIRTKG